MSPLRTAGLGLVLYATLLVSSTAHEAPSGWTYDISCCSQMDCREIKDDDIEITPQGYVIKATGETVTYDGKSPTGIKLKKSKDEHFHRCSSGYPGSDKGRTWCLYVPPFGS